MKKEYILECARSIIQQNGVQHLFMDEVARRCGISKKTIYTLFESKEALLESLVLSFVEERNAIFSNELSMQQGPKMQIEFVLDFLFNLMHLIPYENLLFLEKRHPEIHKILDQFIADIFEQFEQILANGQKSDFIYADIDLSKKISLMRNELSYIHQHYRQFTAENSLEDWQEQFMQSFRRSTFLS
ncbi:TetR/AcrR family transcriptional regulator [Catalinimonas niigatensis]|uniref:TetR/AcrR family transcriptional regulator n=1 Tax=Catalinimonas niigatensis TaxID=1397264 RepID=UPI002666930E|nr:TetR/AcrR family transcriptional regulator [Catalinimonas niigatensis]WPP51093.1 TetR/AcrR family transcriptional regulator [Catalinimonas niigatensis]